MSVTQKQIAEKLSVSSSLVGRALRGDLAVAQSTRERIAQAAREMGYDAGANREARFLAARRYGTRPRNDGIAVLYPAGEGGGHTLRSLPLYAALMDGIEAEAADQETEVCLSPASPASLPRLVRERNADGAILLWHTSGHIVRMTELGLPAATVFEHQPGVAGLTVDDQDGAYQATRHLLESGHRRIGFLGVREQPGLPGAALRLQGYLDAMKEFGQPAPAELRETGLQLPATTPSSYCAGCRVCAACVGWQTLMHRNRALTSRGELPFSALVCYNDAVAMGAIEVAQRAGVSVPGELSVTGFDDLSALYHFRPSITSVQYSPFEMGRNIFRILQKAINRDLEETDSEESELEDLHYIFPVTLAVRETTAPLEGAALAAPGPARQRSLF